MQRIFTLLAGVAVAFSAHAELQHVEVSITWPMANADREAVLTPVITDGFEGYFTADEPVLGSKMYWGVPRTINGVAFNLVQPIETAANADDDGHTVSFKFTVNNGYAFEPTSFEYLGSAIGTSGGNYNLDYTWGGNTTLIQKDFHPNRNKEEYGYFSDVKENLTSTVSDGTFDATFHIYNLVENKQIGLANVTVKGILYIGEGIKPVLTWSAENYEVSLLDENPAYPTLTAEPAENAAEILAGVTYTSSNEEVAAVDADGTVTIVGRGETTITASFEANDNYYCATASYTLTVVDPNFIDKTWDASTWTQSVYSSTVTIDGLTLHATESRLIKASNYLYLNGAAVEEEGVLGRALSFKVPGKVKITIESRSSNQTHTLALAAGEWTNVISMQSFDEKDTKTFCYTGDATTLYIYSTWSSIYIYSIHVVSLPDEETPEAPTAAPTVDVLELDENGNLEIEFNLAEGNVLYYAYTEDAVAPEEAPQRIVYQGTTYEEAEGNTVSLTGVNPGTLKYFVHDPATGMTSERTEVAVHKYGYTTGLVEISANAEAEAEYYTTQGIRVAAPTAAGVYICRKGTEVTKVLVK